MANVVVLGSGFAGSNVALELARTKHDVEVVDIQGYHEYTPALIDLYRGRYDEEDLRINLNDLYDGTGVEFTRESVEDIKPSLKKVKTNAGEINYDYLVIALGSESRTFGIDLENAEAPYSLNQTKESVENVEDADKITIVGSGYVGVEVAGELAEMDKEVTVVDSSTRPMSNSSKDVSHKVLSYMNNTGINFRGGKRVKRIESGECVLENGKSIEHDACIWSAGIQASSIVQESLDAEPCGLEVDKTLRYTKYPDIFALGDCADTEQINTAHNAMRQADIVAANIGEMKSDMKELSSSKYPLLVSLGDKGLMNYGDLALKSVLLRKAKDLVFKWYKFTLKWKNLKASFL